MTPILIVIVLIVLIVMLSSFARTVPQATVAVVTVFGKYRRIMREGLNFKMPWEAVSHRLSLQNRALQLEFQAITQDQANVKFATMVLYAVAGSDEEAIKKAVFSRIAPRIPARPGANHRRLDSTVCRYPETGRYSRHARRDRGAHKEESR